jgi:diamine N-acetyltransferase
MYEIKLLENDNLEIIIPFLQLLDPKLTTEELEARLPKMVANNYSCIGVYDNENLIGISGFWLIQKYYTGLYIEPDNVVIDPKYRGKKIGELMSNWLENFARKNNCVASNLNVYATNNKAIKFWLNQGYKIISFHLQKKF